MPRPRHWCFLVVGLAACSHGGGPKSVEPEQGQAGAAGGPVPIVLGPDSVLPARSPEDSVRDAELREALANKIAADSAADIAILEQLQAAHPDSGDSAALPDDDPATAHGGANEVATPVTWDIDVQSYNSHARVQYYLDFFQTTARERMEVWLTRMPRYEPMIRAKLREYGVPEDMVYLALIESGYSNTAVSRSRATGMWQFMKGTGKLYGLRVDSWVDERRDPYKATDAAARHLADLRDRFGSMYLAAAAYNAGAGKVGRGLKRLGDDDEEEDNPDADFFRLYDTRFLRRETKDYVPKLIAAALIAKQPAKYGFPKVEGIGPLTLDSIVVPDATGLDVLARLADTSTASIRELNAQYLRGVTPPKMTSVVRLPSGTGERVAVSYAALPAKERITYVDHIVTRGQTLSQIAKLYGVSTKSVTAANPSLKAKSLRTGTHVVVPTSGARLPAVEASSTRRVAVSSTASGEMYRVSSGESLWSIGQKVGVSIEQLRAWNGLSPTEGLKAGQRIRISPPGGSAPSASPSPSVTGRVHTVRSGETLSGIAQKYHVGLSALCEANNMTTRSVLKSGAKLTIPD